MAIAVLIALGSSQSYSQQDTILIDHEPCNTGGWDTIPWNDTEYRIITVGGCQFIYEFTTKNLGFGNPIIQITSISRLNNCTPTPSITEAKRLAYVELIQSFDNLQEE